MALDPITAVLNIGNDLIQHFFPSAIEQSKAKATLEQLRQNGELAVIAEKAQLQIAQIAVDNTEAAKGGLMGDWRDGIGWVCALIFGWQYFLQPALTWFVVVVFKQPPPVLPHFDIGPTQQIMLGLLGLSANGLKQIEKRFTNVGTGP